MKRILSVVVPLLVMACLAGCGGDAAKPSCPLCVPKEPCPGDDAVLHTGSAVTMINQLRIGTYEEGFDFNADGDPDNALAALGSLANSPIKDSLKKGEIIIPFEFYDLDPTPAGVTNDDCVHFGVYMGKYPQDADEDGLRTGGASDTGKPGEDCNDRADDPLAASIHPGATESANLVDDDCNGLADETLVPFPDVPDGGVPDGGEVNCDPPNVAQDGGCLTVSDNTDDNDGDGVTLADGDCDDRATPEITIDGETHPIGWFSKPGNVEVCGDGLDNDCSGAADDGCTPYCDPLLASGTAACGATYLEKHGDGVDTVAVDPLTVDGDAPKIAFLNGTIADGVLHAGPSLFALTIPIQDNMNIDFRISAAILEGGIAVDDRGGVSLTSAMLGGVLDAQALDRINGLEVSDINLTKDDSLLDVVFVAFLAQANLLGLKQVNCNPACPPEGCLIPDIDVDGDGFECFIDDQPDDDVNRVTLCVDGDGTEVRDGFETDAQGNPKACTEALLPDGTPRFRDGLSITLAFDTLPVKLGAVEPAP